MVARVPNVAQAFEAVRQVVVDAMTAAESSAEADGFAEALGDLDVEGPHAYGWWSLIGGREIWYSPVTTTVPEGLEVGELALLATVGAPSVVVTPG